MYFFMPFTPYLRTIGIYVLAAIVPAVFLMRYIYNRDTVEREPGYLLRSLALQGVFAALAAIVLEKAVISLLRIQQAIRKKPQIPLIHTQIPMPERRTGHDPGT